MPRDVYASISLMRGVDIDAFADWLEASLPERDDDEEEDEASDDERDSVVPIDDIDV